jgi:restriction system protein
MKEFVIDHTTQRRRCADDDDPKQLGVKVRDLRQNWTAEAHELTSTGWHVGPENTNDWKGEELRKTLSFPSPPTPTIQASYQSLFEVREALTRPAKKLHMEEYFNFRASIGDAEKHRLMNRLPKSPQYPVVEPTFLPFPARMKDSALKELPTPPKKLKPTKWYHYLMLLDLLSNNEQFRKATEKFGKQRRQIEEFNSWLSELQTDRRLYYEERKAEFDERAKHVKDQWDSARLQWETAVASDISKYRELYSGYESGKSAEVAQYFQAQLEAIPLLPCSEREYEIEFEEQEGILLINLKLPYVRDLEITKTKQFVSGPKVIPASQKETRDIVNQLPFLLLMRIIWEVPQVDDEHKVRLIACNGYVVYDDPATGKVRQDVILTIVAKPEELEQIRLEKVDPEVSFRALKGIAAAKIIDLIPVQPLVQFNKYDSRFVAAKEIIDHLGDINLATMDWQDFEHLIRELFEKEFGQAGAEVRVTQASRDRGVDAIAFDPDPLRGGKFVIQAKRYTNTVDVSAVRDLYGTVVNEGANRGILVTTSNYGRDAYDFAKNKPLTLLNGANLLHLLEKHGYNVRIDLKEAKRLVSEATGGSLQP